MPYIERLLRFLNQPSDFLRHWVGISFFFFSTVVLFPPTLEADDLLHQAGNPLLRDHPPTRVPEFWVSPFLGVLHMASRCPSIELDLVVLLVDLHLLLQFW